MKRETVAELLFDSWYILLMEKWVGLNVYKPPATKEKGRGLGENGYSLKKTMLNFIEVKYVEEG